MNLEDIERCVNSEFGASPSKEIVIAKKKMAEERDSFGSWVDTGDLTDHMTGRELTLDPSSLDEHVGEAFTLHNIEKRLSQSWECPRTHDHQDSGAPHSADFNYATPQCVPSKKTDGPDNTDKIKSKLMTAWNNMRHVWAVKTKTNFKYDSTIHLLGKEYPCTSEERDNQRSDIENGLKAAPTSFEMFLDDFKSRIWLTYRRGFEILPGSSLNTDVGWGCMIRSGQMMLAQALLVHKLQRNWRLEHTDAAQLQTYRNVVRFFGDFDCELTPFSLHKLVQIGEAIGKKPGDWYGPSSVAYVLRDAVELAQINGRFPDDFCIYVAQDCTVYKQDVIDMCTRKEVRSRENSSSSSSASPALSSKHTHHPSPKATTQIEHLDVQKPKNKSVFYTKLEDSSKHKKDPARLSFERLNLSGEHSDTDSEGCNSQHLGTMCDTASETVHTGLHTNGSTTGLGQSNTGSIKQDISYDSQHSDRTINNGASPLSVNGGEDYVPPLNPLYTYKPDYCHNFPDTSASNSTNTPQGMNRVTSLGHSEQGHSHTADSTSNHVNQNTPTLATQQNRFNPFNTTAPTPASPSPSSSSSSQEQHKKPASFLHHKFEAQAHSYREFWRPVLILIPVRLGGLEFNPVYSNCLKRVLQSSYSVGIIGGKPKHSLIFMGWQDEKLLYLDPHFCQDHVDTTDPNFQITTFQCESPRKMSFSKLDPSCTLGFYCRTYNEFNNFVVQSERLASPGGNVRGEYPLYVFSEGRSTDVSYLHTEQEERHLRLRRIDRYGRPKKRHPSKESTDDFVLL